MAERMAEKAADEAGIDATFSSAGVSSEETGNPIDPRAVSTLQAAGCRTGDHRAHRITADEVAAAELVICAEEQHRDRVVRLVPDAAERIHLLTDFVPGAEPGSPVPDPWYGEQDGFTRTADTIARALPQILDQLPQPHGRP